MAPQLSSPRSRGRGGGEGVRGTRASGSGPSRRVGWRRLGFRLQPGFFWRGEAAVRAGGGKGGDATRRRLVGRSGVRKRNGPGAEARGSRPLVAPTTRRSEGEGEPTQPGRDEAGSWAPGPWSLAPGPGGWAGAAALPRNGLGGRGSVSATPAHVRVPFDASSTGKGPKHAAKKGAEKKPHDGTTQAIRHATAHRAVIPSLARRSPCPEYNWHYGRVVAHAPTCGRLLQSRSHLPQAPQPAGGDGDGVSDSGRLFWLTHAFFDRDNNLK